MKTNSVSLENPFGTWLRAEAVVELAVLVVAYRALGGGWWMLAALFPAPDVAMLGYLVNARVGATLYNLAHNYALAGAVLLGVYGATGELAAAWLAWPIHIALDRALGYGLKSAAGFRETHLARIGE